MSFDSHLTPNYDIVVNKFSLIRFGDYNFNNNINNINDNTFIINMLFCSDKMSVLLDYFVLEIIQKQYYKYHSSIATFHVHTISIRPYLSMVNEVC